MYVAHKKNIMDEFFSNNYYHQKADSFHSTISAALQSDQNMSRVPSTSPRPRQYVPVPTPPAAPPPTQQPPPTSLNSAMGIIAPPPVATGTPRPQFWRFEAAVRPEGTGSIEFSPEQPELLYFLGDTVELTAKCDFGFLRWAGRSAEGLDETANPLTITVDGSLLIYALCDPPPYLCLFLYYYKVKYISYLQPALPLPLA